MMQQILVAGVEVIPFTKPGQPRFGRRRRRDDVRLGSGERHA